MVPLKPIIHWKLCSRWLPNANEINTKNMKCTWPTPEFCVGTQRNLYSTGLRLGFASGKTQIRGFALAPRYQHIAKFWRGGYCPTPTPSARYFASQWNIGFNIPISDYAPYWDCQIGVAVNRDPLDEVQAVSEMNPAECVAECKALSSCKFVQLIPTPDNKMECHLYKRFYNVFDAAACPAESPRCHYCYPSKTQNFALKSYQMVNALALCQS